MEPKFESRYLKLYRMEEKTLVEYKPKNGKTIKTFIDHNVHLRAQSWENE
jgi:hypothetical protein